MSPLSRTRFLRASRQLLLDTCGHGRHPRLGSPPRTLLKMLWQTSVRPALPTSRHSLWPRNTPDPQSHLQGKGPASRQRGPAWSESFKFGDRRPSLCFSLTVRKTPYLTCFYGQLLCSPGICPSPGLPGPHERASGEHPHVGADARQGPLCHPAVMCVSGSNVTCLPWRKARTRRCSGGFSQGPCFPSPKCPRRPRRDGKQCTMKDF